MSANVGLTDEELVLLDGKCSDAVQQKVDAAIRRLEFGARLSDLTAAEAGLIADAVARAETDGKLICRTVYVKSCPVCKKRCEYAKYTRSSRYHRRGQPNYDRPRLFPATELADAFLRIKNYLTLGCCAGCWSKVEEHLKAELRDVRAELPPELAGPVKYRRYKRRHCTKCDWIGHEGKMLRDQTLLGNGTYPSRCPQCNAGGGFLNHDVELADGYAIEEMTP